jgi:hypothetical protein
MAQATKKRQAAMILSDLLQKVAEWGIDTDQVNHARQSLGDSARAKDTSVEGVVDEMNEIMGTLILPALSKVAGEDLMDAGGSYEFRVGDRTLLEIESYRPWVPDTRLYGM